MRESESQARELTPLIPHNLSAKVVTRRPVHSIEKKWILKKTDQCQVNTGQ